MAETTAEMESFEAKFAKWRKNYKGYDLSSTKPYRAPSEGTHLVASLTHPEVQYDARDPTFLRRSTARDEIKEEFKPGKGVDAAVFFKAAPTELRAQMFEKCQTRMEDLLQRRRDASAALIPEYEDLQKQLLQATKDWRSAVDATTRVQAVLHIGTLQKQLAEVDERRNRAMYPNTYTIAYKSDNVTSKKATAAVWRTADTAAAETGGAPAEKKKFGAASTVEKNGYRLVRSMTSAVDRTVLFTEEDTA
jgi:hypothetical protein